MVPSSLNVIGAHGQTANKQEYRVVGALQPTVSAQNPRPGTKKTDLTTIFITPYAGHTNQYLQQESIKYPNSTSI